MSFIQQHQAGNPTLVLLHGTGGDEREMLAFGKRLSGRTGYLALRGKEPEGPANRWFRRISEGVFDEPNLRFRAAELAEHIDATLPNVRRIAVGFSNGANMGAAILLLYPRVFDSAVLLAPMVPLQPESMPDLVGKPVLMICGRRDPIVPPTNAEALASSMLRAAGADVTLHWHEGGHYPGAVEIGAVRAWIGEQIDSER